MASEEARWAEGFAAGDPGTFPEVETATKTLRRRKEFGPIAPMLIEAGRRALGQEWERDHRVDLAKLLRANQQFGYARRLLGRVRREVEDSEELRQQHALCTYKDMELPAARALDRAEEILKEGGPLEESSSAETLGIAGAIFKRRWEVDGKRADLQSARGCYERGYALEKDPQRTYAGINAAFVCDLIASLEEQGLGDRAEAKRLRRRAHEIRTEIVAAPRDDSDEWIDATLGEAFFGLEDFEKAEAHLRRRRESEPEPWCLESTAMQLATLGRLLKVDQQQTSSALEALLGDAGGAIDRSSIGKVGLALSGGGFRASLFHLGVLARLAECGVLRRVEVLSCVSGGSIVGAFYYLHLRKLLQSCPDHELEDRHYVELVEKVIDEFLAGVRRDLRGHLFTDPRDDARMISPKFSRTNRVAELLDRDFYSKIPREGGEASSPWRMTDLFVTPAGRGEDFSLRYENWLRRAKVPMLVLNATTLNTGHNWQFTASWMGEPPIGVDEKVDASRRLRRVYYRDAPPGHREPALSTAVAASACVPGLFPPVALEKLYEADGGKRLDVELVDGGVHDNQGIASLLEQGCTVMLVSDASGQARDAERPSRGILGVSKRSNSVLMARVRGAQYADLGSRKRAGVLRGLMIVHLKKGLLAKPRDWIGCEEEYEAEEDALSPRVATSADYGIGDDVQRALAELRTDLDSFSDDEAYALMAAGYLMASNDLGEALPELATPDPALEAAWPFGSTLKRMRDPKLAESLRPGHWLLFRRLRTWWQRIRD